MTFPFFCSARRKGSFWFRIFGYGLVIKDLRQTRMDFSERYGLYRGFRLGKWLVRILVPGGI